MGDLGREWGKFSRDGESSPYVLYIGPYEKQEYPVGEFGECRFKKNISRKRREQGILNAARCGGYAAVWEGGA